MRQPRRPSEQVSHVAFQAKLNRVARRARAAAPVRLDAKSIEDIAQALACLVGALGPASAPRRALVDAIAIAQHLSVEPKWVREHASELGGQKLTDGPRGRWRFDPEVAAARFRSRA